MNNIKLIVTDLDNTLLRRDKSISGYTVSVFQRLRERGVLAAFATSRSERASARFRVLVTPDINITSGGAIAKMGERQLFRSAIDIHTATAIIADLKSFPDVLQITADTQDYYFNSQPIDKNQLAWVDYADSVTTDFTDPLPVSDVFKITPSVTNADAVQRIVDLYPTVDLMRFTGEDWYQIKSSGASKNFALAAVCEELDIGLSEVIVFGDDINDVGLFCLVHSSGGTAVAVNNAIEECKECADYICGDCDDDGVARWLEGNLLKAQ
jgi:Cof subfamily protein (haloacid dehalogenase superfamily)